MNADILTLCDKLECPPNGKVSFIGVFEFLKPGKVPLQIHQFTAVAKIRFKLEEGETHSYQIKIISPDGQVIAKKDPSTFSTKPFPDKKYAFAYISEEIIGLPIPTRGTYSVVFEVDKANAWDIPLFVI